MSQNANYTAIVQVKVSDNELKRQLISITKKIPPINIKANFGELQSFNSALKNTTANIGRYNKVTNQSAVSTRNLKENLSGTQSSIASIGKDFVDTTLKVAKFGLSTKLIALFQSSIVEAKDAVFDFDSALTEFKKVSDLSGESLDQYTENLGKMGAEVARTRAEMVSASSEFKKGGFSDEESAQLARVASLYQNVADSELSAGDASAYVISQMKAFDISAEDAMSIIDKTNEVSNNFAVSSTDISSALTKTAGALSTYGNTIDETMGLVTAGTEILTGQAGKVSRGLK